MDDKTLVEIVERIADLLAEKYVFPQVGEQIARQLRQGLAETLPS